MKKQIEHDMAESIADDIFSENPPNYLLSKDVKGVHEAIPPDYKGFAHWCMAEGPWAGMDLDGQGIQDAALRFGIVKWVPFDPKAHDDGTIYAIKEGDPWLVLVG